MSALSSLRIGLVAYANALPLEVCLAQPLPDARLVWDIPANLGAMLARNELDAAMLSSIELGRCPEYGFIPGIGICSDGPVRSVCLFTKKDPVQVETVALDTSSLTSVILLRILFAEFWRHQPRFVWYSPPVEEGLRVADAALSIGDPTLNSHDLPVRKIDLGETWKAFTGLPFVYAVWIVRPGLHPADLVTPFAEAKRLGLARVDQIAEQCAEKSLLDAEFFRRYFKENLTYDLGERELQGMTLFFAKAKPFLDRNSAVRERLP